MAGVATTHPSSSTGPDHSRRWPATIRWVSPEPRVTALDHRLVVGRGEDCDVILAGTEISRRHAELWTDGPVAGVIDRESRNGVFVNGRRVLESRLASGDVIRCGEWLGILTKGPGEVAPFGEISPGWYGGGALRAAMEPARLAAATLPAIIVQGETGTGKEGAARAIHAWGRRTGPLIAVNCATLPPHLAEAELFGHRKGAFTGADMKNEGLFRAAHGGTLFLDEILDLPLALQPKLLRVLEERAVRPVGETRPIPIDVRVVAATQEPLGQPVAAQRFRADLYARLDGLTVVLPPLRDRRTDIVPLFSTVLANLAASARPQVESKLLEALCVYDWPLNVRELVSTARRLLAVHGQEPVLKKAYLPDQLRDGVPPGPSGVNEPTPGASGARRAWRRTDDETEFERLIEALRGHGGSVAKAAAQLGMNRSRAYRLLDAHPTFVLDGVRR